MDSFDTQSLHALTDEQIERLAAVIVEDFGPDLSRTQFNDVALLLLEDIAGCEVMTQQQTDEHVRSAWITYRRLITSNRSH
jgi:hypothetical protein